VKGTCSFPGLVPFLCTKVQSSLCTPVTPAVPYMLTGLTACSVGPGISCGERKLARTPRVTKKKEEEMHTLPEIR